MVLTWEACPPPRTLEFGPGQHVGGKPSGAEGGCLCPPEAARPGGRAGCVVNPGPVRQAGCRGSPAPLSSGWHGLSLVSMHLWSQAPSKRPLQFHVPPRMPAGAPQVGPYSFPVQESGVCRVVLAQDKCPVSLESRVPERKVEVTQFCLAGHQ